MITAEYLIRALGLRPHPMEGGYFAETYRSKDRLKAGALPSRYRKGARGKTVYRPAGTAIYYLLTSKTRSPLHRLRTDEMVHFYLGDPAELVLLGPKGTCDTVVLGNRPDRGMHLQFTVPRGVWMGIRLKRGGKFALLGTTMAPGFDYSDYEEGTRAVLLRSHPGKSVLIESLTDR